MFQNSARKKSKDNNNNEEDGKEDSDSDNDSDSESNSDDEEEIVVEDNDEENNNNKQDETSPLIRVKETKMNIINLMKLFNSESAEIYCWSMAHEFHGTHGFRHGGAQDASEEGGLALVMLRTGHESRGCAMHYATHDALRTKAVQKDLNRYANKNEWYQMTKNANRLIWNDPNIIIAKDIRHQVVGMELLHQRKEEAQQQQYQNNIHDLEDIAWKEIREKHFHNEDQDNSNSNIEEKNNNEDAAELNNKIDELQQQKNQHLLQRLQETLKQNTILGIELEKWKKEQEKWRREAEKLNKLLAESKTLPTRKTERRQREQHAEQQNELVEVNLEEVCKRINSRSPRPKIFKVKKQWRVDLVAALSPAAFKGIQITDSGCDFVISSLDIQIYQQTMLFKEWVRKLKTLGITMEEIDDTTMELGTIGLVKK